LSLASRTRQGSPASPLQTQRPPRPRLRQQQLPEQRWWVRVRVAAAATTTAAAAAAARGLQVRMREPLPASTTASSSRPQSWPPLPPPSQPAAALLLLVRAQGHPSSSHPPWHSRAAARVRATGAAGPPQPLGLRCPLRRRWPCSRRSLPSSQRAEAARAAAAAAARAWAAPWMWSALPTPTCSTCGGPASAAARAHATCAPSLPRCCRWWRLPWRAAWRRRRLQSPLTPRPPQRRRALRLQPLGLPLPRRRVRRRSTQPSRLQRGLASCRPVPAARASTRARELMGRSWESSDPARPTALRQR